MKILVDEDQWIRDSLILFFEAEGCSLMTLETAEEGMAAVKHQDLDIVIPDYKLPGMDGLEFLKKVKKRNPAAVEILITAYGSYDLYKEAENMGIQDFIPKPFTSVYIEMSLTRVIQKTE